MVLSLFIYGCLGGFVWRFIKAVVSPVRTQQQQLLLLIRGSCIVLWGSRDAGTRFGFVSLLFLRMIGGTHKCFVAAEAGRETPSFIFSRGRAAIYYSVCCSLSRLSSLGPTTPDTVRPLTHPHTPCLALVRPNTAAAAAKHGNDDTLTRA